MEGTQTFLMTIAFPYLCWPVPRSPSPFLQWFENLFVISPCACLIMDLKIKLGILIFLDSALKSLLLHKQEARTDENYMWWTSQKSLKFQILPAHNNPLKSYQFLVNNCCYAARRDVTSPDSKIQVESLVFQLRFESSHGSCEKNLSHAFQAPPL